MLRSFLFLNILTVTLLSLAQAQFRDFRVHDRGMLHETVFNTGEIGRGWETGEGGNVASKPVFEWPPYSRTIVDGIEYSGQHNMLGAGMYMAANLDGITGKENRIYALCGGVGASDPEIVAGKWSFPLSIDEWENYPVLEDGSLNPSYDPNEAEEVITASWATPVGVTVTRTSRAWSYPDYDDLIIYEYTLEYTGDTDGDPTTIEQTETLKDFMALFIYGFAPSMYGYQRWYNEWKYEDGIYRGDQNGFWDADYWLSFNLNLRTEKVNPIWAKPEPDLEKFLENASTGKNGGGLTSPQAPGYCVLYYDTNHLAVVDRDDPNANESEAVKILRVRDSVYYELDENKHFKQPWSNKVSTGNTRSSKMVDQSINPDSRWSGVLSEGSTTWPEVANFEERWYGRAAFNYRQSVDAGQKHTVFGPYTLNIGDKLEYAIAEVVGYGGTPGKRVEGTTGAALVQWNNTPSWNRIVRVDGKAWTDSGYIDQYGYPDYVNSDVVTVTQVAHKAFEAYLGKSIAIDSVKHEPVDGPFWPEDHPKDGSYIIPVPVPAPGITVSNTPLAEIEIIWGRAVEEFEHPQLTGELSGFKVWRSETGMGPWELLSDVTKGDVNENEEYLFLDTDPDFKVGEARYYSVTSVDVNGFESGKTNIIRHEKNIGSVLEFGKVHVAPNPFIVESGFTGGGEVVDKIGFFGLPNKCKIRIFSYAGQLITTIDHDVPVYSNEWFQVTRNDQSIASGIYFFVVTTPDGDKTSGKFIVIK
ncbi:MAG: T9SS C-terminal target domain-containing protein [Calditrichaeota bacterium]|nr:MAG: T9SS C-terminal target domain-containing protein [Calditrichota bacterium]MBL1208114.1 T9SS C-terminal target domain-containing protein [Calditrichota bacterium]NOG47952.1 T9SS type A sorting domain-containing protein [Calditrichota bacterium]